MVVFGSSTSNPIWRAIWSLKVPAKIKIHCWRASLGAIPCNGVLAIRHIQISSQCPLCQLDCESIRHSFFQCPRVKDIWHYLGLLDIVQRACLEEVNGVPALTTLLLDSAAMPIHVEIRRSDLIAVAVWYAWWERRKFTHGEKVYDPDQSAQAILALAINYKRAKSPNSGPIVRHGWEKPQDDLVKLNIDAAFDIDSGTDGTGAILRDHHGTFISAGRWKLQHVDDAYTAEAHGLRNGLLLANMAGCNKVLVESDCMEVIQPYMKNALSCVVTLVVSLLIIVLGRLIEQLTS